MSSIASSAGGTAEKKSNKKQRGSYSTPRTLCRWNPDVDQLVLLTVDSVCKEQGVPIDYETVAKRIQDTMTGEAIKQHLAKVIKARVFLGRPVPQPPQKKFRRKAGQSGNANPTTPVKGGRVKNKNGEDVDAEQIKKFRSLVYTPATTTKKKTPATPGGARGGGRKKANVKTGGDEVDVSKDLETPTKSTGKRGRGAKKEDKSVDPEESDDGSPLKKQKRSTRRSAARNVDYNEQYNSDEQVFDAHQEGDNDGEFEAEGDDDEEEEEEEELVMKYENNSPQNNDNIYDFAPMAPPIFSTPVQQTTHQDFPPPQTPNYVSAYGNNNNYTSPSGMQASGFVPQSPVFGRGQANNFTNPFHFNQPSSPRQYGGSGHNPYGINFDRQMGGHDYGMGMPLPPILPSKHTPPGGSFENVLGDAEGGVQDKKPSITRNNTSSGEKKSKKGKKSEDKNQGAGQGVDDGSAMNIESAVTGTAANPFVDHNSGFGNDNINTDATNTSDVNINNFKFSNIADGSGLHVDTNAFPALDTGFTTSPDGYGNINECNGGMGNVGSMTNYNNFGNNHPQLGPDMSYNNSFGCVSTFNSTVAGTPTDEAMQATNSGNNWLQDTNNNDGFNPNAYEMQMPDDEFANAALFGMDGMNGGFFDTDGPDGFVH